MKIQIDPHTIERAEERGTNPDEIQDVLLHGIEISAKRNRKAKEKIYPFRQIRLGVYYEKKKVRVIYAAENDIIITVPCYVFYGQWE